MREIRDKIRIITNICQMKECTNYGYVLSRNSTRALVKDWECSFNKGWTNVSGRTRKQARTTPRHVI